MHATQPMPAPRSTGWGSALPIQRVRGRLVRHPRAFTAALVLIAWAAALVGALALRPVSEQGAFGLLLGAVMLGAWRGGLPAGLFATALGGLALTYLFEEPPYSWAIERLDTLVDLVVFVLVAWLISALSDRLHDARTRAEEARAAAEEAVRIREGVLAVVAHDLRSPLTAIKGQADLLRRRIARDADPERTAWVHRLDTIGTLVGRLDSAIDELLDAARIRSGAPLLLRTAPVELAQLVRRMVVAHQERHPDRVIRLTLRGVPLIGIWDERRLERVVDNLVGNALKYSPAGGEVHVEVSADTRADGLWAVVQVSDAGVGIPPAHLARIFEPFWRAPNVVSHIAGTGIGLASVRDIVAQHGGRIAVDSRVGAGSTFRVHLPLAPGSPNGPST